jgi:hypothetical protein
MWGYGMGPPWENDHPYSDRDFHGRSGPPARTCTGCRAPLWRNNSDPLCARCAAGVENLIERIEIDSIGSDLDLLVAFEAYCHRREAATRC